MDDMLAIRDVSAIELGLDAIVRSLTADLAIHNRLTADMIGIFADVSSDIRRRYGVGSTIRMSETDEFGRAHTQKAVTGSDVNFPLRGFQSAIGWTADFFRYKSVADMATTQQAAEAGHVLEIRTQMQKAIYGSSNYTFNDYRATKTDLAIKRFVNADGAPIPNGPNGETFNASTHTHYLGSATLTDTAAAALVATVVEHHQDGQPRVFINSADEAGWRALTNFKAYVDTRLTLPDNASNPTVRLNPFRTNDRPIGLYGAAEVWVKPWAIANYAVCMDVSEGVAKPLVARVRPGGSTGLRVAGTNVLFPLQAEYMEAEFGFGVWTRTNGAVLYHANATYADPTIS